MSSPARRLAINLELLLRYLRAVVLCRIAHNFGFIDWGLAPPVRIRRAVRRALSAALDKDMSLFVRSVSRDTKLCLQLLQLESDKERTFSASFREKLFSQ